MLSHLKFSNLSFRCSIGLLVSDFRSMDLEVI